jgi:hypothetical protein
LHGGPATAGRRTRGGHAKERSRGWHTGCVSDASRELNVSEMAIYVAVALATAVVVWLLDA